MSITFQEQCLRACGRSAHKTRSCIAHNGITRQNLVWRSDNDLLKPSSVGCYYHPGQKGSLCLSHLYSRTDSECTKKTKQTKICRTWITRVLFAESAHEYLRACTKPACLCRAAQMGVWGDGCCQLTDQAVGRWSHCYSPHKHAGHVRHAPRRHIRAGYCARVCARLP